MFIARRIMYQNTELRIQAKDKMNGQDLIVQLHDAVHFPAQTATSVRPPWQVRDGDQKLVEYIIKERADVNQRGTV